MIGTPIPGGNRYFCGRRRRAPWWVRLVDALGWHQELYRVAGETVVRTRWVRSDRLGESIYTCRKRMDHWRVTIKPQGTRRVTLVHDRNFNEAGVKEAEAKGIQNVDTPYWRAKRQVGKTTRETLPGAEIPTEAWELGHKYEFTRWQELA